MIKHCLHPEVAHSCVMWQLETAGLLCDEQTIDAQRPQALYLYTLLFYVTCTKLLPLRC